MISLDLRDKTAIVGGSSKGIGRATAIELASAGANVIAFARNEEALKALMKELNTDHGQNHSYYSVDYSKPETLQSTAEEIVQNTTVHILINNTGGPAAGPVYDANPEAFEEALRQHVVCNQLLTQALAPGMKKAGFGRIINIISTSVKQPIPNLGVSNTIRGAVANWSKTLSMELASEGITVNNVLPGYTNTQRLDNLINNKAKKQGKSYEDVEKDMKLSVPAQRFGEPEELAYAICFLASPLAGYINGINVPVDGGRTGSL